MPGPLEDFFVVQDEPEIAVRPEPAHNALNSLLLLVKACDKPSIDPWVARTAAALTDEERRTHELVVIGFFYAIVPDATWPSFPAYLDYLAALDPIDLRGKLLRTYARFPATGDATCHDLLDDPAPLDTNAVLASADAYLAFLRERFSPKFLDEDLERRAYTYVRDPPAMHELIVSHLRHMWDRYLAEEWARVEPFVRKAVDVLDTDDLGRMSRLEAVEWATGQELPGWEASLDRAERIVLVPAGHGGPHAWRTCTGGVTWVLFGTRPAETARQPIPELTRSEVLVRLGALADGSRLRVLELVAERGEQSSQQIISGLGLSQSAVSRHLKQLCATEFLSERRCGGAKCYSLNAGNVRESLQAISSYLVGD
jgi:ArsR family transcriptional regulator